MSSSQSNKKKSIAGSNNATEDTQKKELVPSSLEPSSEEGARYRIRVNLERLRKFLAPNKAASDVLSEAVSYAEVECTWTFWSCCCCDRRFGKPDSHLKHFLEEHVETLPEDMAHLIPLPLSEEWAKKINEDSWEPIDMCTGATDESGDREKIIGLKRVSLLLQMLFVNGILFESHLTFLSSHCKQVARGSLSKLPPLMKNGVDDNLILRICCLDAPLLRVIINYLEEVMAVGTLDGDGDEILDSPESGVTGTVIPDETFSNIYFDAEQLCKQSGSDSCRGDVESLVSWLYETLDPLDADGLHSWAKFRYARKAQCVKIHQMLEKKFTNLRLISYGKSHHVEKRGMWKKMEDVCMNAYKTTENGANHEVLRAVLSSWGEDLTEIPGTDRYCYRMCVSAVLEETEKADANTCELASHDNGDMITPNVCKESNCILKVLQNRKLLCTEKLATYDAKILKNQSDIQQLKIRLVRASQFDYLTVLMPVMRPYLKAHWEKAGESAKEKSDAAREDPSEELESEKKSDGRVGHQKDKKKKSKGKKKRN